MADREADRRESGLGPGPLDLAPFPETLEARIVEVEANGERRIVGYATQADLAASRGLTDAWYAALCGELPTTTERELVEVALVIASAICVGEAPSHAALLARLCGSDSMAALGVGALGLGEELADRDGRFAALWAWLAAGAAEARKAAVVSRFDHAELASYRRVVSALERRGLASLNPAALPADLALPPLALAMALLWRAGLPSLDSARVLLCAARLPLVMAEALAQPVGTLKDYPMNQPPLRYVGGDRGDGGEVP